MCPAMPLWKRKYILVKSSKKISKHFEEGIGVEEKGNSQNAIPTFQTGTNEIIGR